MTNFLNPEALKLAEVKLGIVSTREGMELFVNGTQLELLAVLARVNKEVVSRISCGDKEKAAAMFEAMLETAGEM